MNELLRKTGASLYRCSALTDSELQEYKDNEGKAVKDEDEVYNSGTMVLTGYLSTSMNRNAALEFAWSNDEKKATLFEIHFRDAGGYGATCMDMSAFPKEQEILLEDG